VPMSHYSVLLLLLFDNICGLEPTDLNLHNSGCYVMQSKLISFRQPLPNVTSSVETELDRNIRYYRQVELLAIANGAAVLRENATDVEEALTKIDGFSSTLKNMCNEVKYHFCLAFRVAPSFLLR